MQGFLSHFRIVALRASLSPLGAFRLVICRREQCLTLMLTIEFVADTHLGAPSSEHRRRTNLRQTDLGTRLVLIIPIMARIRGRTRPARALVPRASVLPAAAGPQGSHQQGQPRLIMPQRWMMLVGQVPICQAHTIVEGESRGILLFKEVFLSRTSGISPLLSPPPLFVLLARMPQTWSSRSTIFSFAELPTMTILPFEQCSGCSRKACIKV